MPHLKFYGVAASVVMSIVVSGCSSSSSDGTNILGANIVEAEVLSDTQGYLVQYNGWQDNTLVEFNPTTGVLAPNPVSGFDGVNISALSVSPEGKLWVGLGDSAAPKISVIDPATALVDDTIGLQNNPTRIVFSENIGVTDCDYCAVITGVDAGYASSWVSVADAESPFSLTERYGEQALSDIRATTYGDNFYRLGRSSQHNITKYQFDNPGVEQWQFSTGANSNPYDIIFASETKAYVLRYGTGEIWVVDPSVSAGDSAGFKLGEIDLSAYDADGVPDMAAGLIVGDRLYVAMQAMDRTTGPWTPGQAYLAVIDTTTDAEVDVSPGDALDGLALTVKNPVDIDVHAGKLFITGAGTYPSSYYGTPAQLTGGVEEITLGTFAQRIVVED